MLDFLTISKKISRNGTIEIYPKFIIKKSSDLMIRGGDFYAIWNQDKNLWSTDEQDAILLIDREVNNYVSDHKNELGASIYVKHMWDSESGMIDSWHKYCQKQMRDSFHMLDEKLIFANDVTTKEDYASKKLDYPLEKGDYSAYDKLMSTLYSEEERHKIEWAIGSIITGDSKHIQKFMVLYGAAGTGKSTVINIIQKLFNGYYSVFDAKALGSSSNSFALEAFKSNPLVAVQHDGDLSRIEDNTRLNSLVSHELMTVNEKFKSTYSNRFKCFLFMGTNKPVKITDAKSGLIRRLIDVSPSGKKVSQSEYDEIINRINFELGAIAYHCREVYLEDPNFYDSYIPINMLGASNDFYNFIVDSYHVFLSQDSTTLSAAWEMYKTYCDEAKVIYSYPKRVFKEELKNYFWEYKDRYTNEDGIRVRSFYSGFRTDIFEESDNTKTKPMVNDFLTLFDSQKSIFDECFKDCPAQYATVNETPTKKWSEVITKLSDIDTTKLHYVKVPINHIVIDFDIPDENGNKDLNKNIEAASKWPPTYAELSKSGKALHLHYYYNGDPERLSAVYSDHIEIKVFKGNSALRRRLTKCNNLPIATINSGLPLKGEKTNMVNVKAVKSEKKLRELISRNLAKSIHSATKPSVDLIYKNLEDAYNSGLKYDVSDLKNDIITFAAMSTNQSDYCLKLCNKMHFKSEEPSDPIESTSDLVFFDVEVFPNLFLINWKIKGKDKPVARMINPNPTEVEKLLHFNLIGFNCRRYDNHMLYGRLIGYDNQQLFDLSQRIINGDKEAFFGEAYNISYTDVYDFASAGNKKSLKKFEIELGIHHQELGLPWDKPVPEEKWTEVAAYCDNDVIATEAVFDYLSADWTARQILADLAGMSVNDTTNSLTTKIIFGNDKTPQDKFNYRDLSKPVKDLDYDTFNFLKGACPEMMANPHGEAHSILPYFPGYTFNYGKSTYKGIEVGEGGRVFSNPGMYTNVALLDIASMHPHSAIAEVLFGVDFTKRFQEIVEGRVNIKHEDWEAVNNMLDGKLTPYVQKVINGEMESSSLADALKTAINSVYGLTSAKFPNKFKDSRNIDNIVAKRGALFMIDLQHEVEAKGFTVAHIKTDSIKIPNATPEIIKFVMDYGKRYGYTFEHEATYSRMCLVNDAVYIAKFATEESCMEQYKYVPKKNHKKPGKWEATGTQFAVPYVFKTLFSKEPITFEDVCEVKSVSTSLYLDFNENLNENEHDLRFIGKVGQFCPILPNKNGGELLREGKDKDGNIKYSAVTGSKGYRWMESEMVKELHKEDTIDKSYYNKMVDDAKDAISKYGDFEWFTSDDADEQYMMPPWKMSCGKDSCLCCPNFVNNGTTVSCELGYDISDIATAMEKDQCPDTFDKR